jgi:hypothetical protein
LILIKRAPKIWLPLFLALLRCSELLLFSVWGKLCTLIRGTPRDKQRLHTPTRGMTRGKQRLYTIIRKMIKGKQLLRILDWTPCMWKQMNGRL